MTGPPRWRQTRLRPEIQRALVTRSTANLFVIAWRWRYELALVSGLATSAAVATVGAWPVIAGAILAAIAIGCWPAARLYVTRRSWRIITPHRVRVGCVEALIYSGRGKIPIILRTSCQPFGERVLLCCRAGTCGEDFASARAVLATACWAKDIVVTFDLIHPQLVTLDVIRRQFSEPSVAYMTKPSMNRDDEQRPWPIHSDRLPTDRT
jgi:hypothetical protein